MPIKPPSFSPRGTPAQRTQAYERERGSPRARGYTTHWDVQARHFKQLNPLCLGCEAVGRVTATKVVDHIIPHRGNQTLFWNPNNRQPACAWHHDVVKQRIEQDYLTGKASLVDLRLDSAMAISITKEMMP